MDLYRQIPLLASALVTIALAACGIGASQHHAPEASRPGSAFGTSVSTGIVWNSSAPVGAASSPHDAGAPSWREAALKEASGYSEIGLLTRDDEDEGHVRLNGGGAPKLGRLPPEVIQRIVRDGYTRLRRCCEEGRGRYPTLTGRVTTRFVIARDGSVSQASNGGSDLPDPVALERIFDVFRAFEIPSTGGRNRHGGLSDHVLTGL